MMPDGAPTRSTQPQRKQPSWDVRAGRWRGGDGSRRQPELRAPCSTTDALVGRGRVVLAASHEGSRPAQPRRGSSHRGLLGRAVSDPIGCTPPARLERRAWSLRRQDGRLGRVDDPKSSYGRGTDVGTLVPSSAWPACPVGDTSLPLVRWPSLVRLRGLERASEVLIRWSSGFTKEIPASMPPRRARSLRAITIGGARTPGRRRERAGRRVSLAAVGSIAGQQCDSDTESDTGDNHERVEQDLAAFREDANRG